MLVANNTGSAGKTDQRVLSDQSMFSPLFLGYLKINHKYS
jgi:hypothetical protein